jgi:hypothetical protein
MTDKEQRIEVAKRMKKSTEINENFTKTLAFMEDAITLMDLTLKEREEV